MMADAETPWQDLIPPDDPRYPTWLVIRGFIQAGDSDARAQVFETYAKSGTFEIEDLVAFATRLFDSGACTVVAANSRGVVAAEKCGGILAEMAGVLISHFKSLPPYKTLARSIARDLDERLEICLMARVEIWKAKAFRIGVEFELAQIQDPGASTVVPPVTPPMSTDSAAPDLVPPSVVPVQQLGAERKALSDSYLANFPEGIVVLDMCWAAGQHYSEWKRWLRGPKVLKDGLTPDKAFKELLTSGKRPREYRKAPRPKGWK